MKNLLLFIACVLMVGCVSTTGVHVQAPQLGAVTQGLTEVSSHIKKSSTSIQAAQQIVSDLDKENPAFITKLSLLDTPLSSALLELSAAEKKIDGLTLEVHRDQGEIDQLTTHFNKESDKNAQLTLDNATLKYHNLWLWITVGGLLAVDALYFYLRIQFPLLKLI